MEMLFFSSVYFLVKCLDSIDIWSHVWNIYLIHLIKLSIRMAIPCSFDFHSPVVQPGGCVDHISNSSFIIQAYLEIMDFSLFLYEI